MVEYVFRAPRYPVIVVAGERVFRAVAKRDVDRLVRREAAAGARVRVLDFRWEWFEYVAEVHALAPSFVDRAAPTKQEVIDLVDRRSNRSEEEPARRRSISSRTREEIFLELLERLPRS